MIDRPPRAASVERRVVATYRPRVVHAFAGLRNRWCGLGDLLNPGEPAARRGLTGPVVGMIRGAGPRRAPSSMTATQAEARPRQTRTWNRPPWPERECWTAFLASSDTPSTASAAAGHPSRARATNRRACLTWSGRPGKTRRRGLATSRAPCPASWVRVPAGTDEDIRASKLVGREVVAPARFSLSAYGALGRAYGQRTGRISRRACRAR
jgi:hypothetical protein